MIKLKESVNKAKLFRELELIADKRFENAYEAELCKEEFMAGAETIFKLMRKTTKQSK